MATEDLTTYTEVDTEGRLTVIAASCTHVGLQKDETCGCYDDKGAGHFSGDYEHLLEMKCTDADVGHTMWPYTLQNLIGPAYSHVQQPDGDMLAIESYGVSAAELYIILVEIDGGDFYSDTYQTGGLGASWYLTVKRDEAVGDHGTLYCYIYDNVARGGGDLVDTLTLTLHSSKKDFRYVYATNANGRTTNAESDGYTKDLDLQEGAPPARTTHNTRSHPLGHSIGQAWRTVG